MAPRLRHIVPWLGVACVGAAVWAAPAFACGSTPRPYLTLAAIDVGADENAFLRDGAIVVTVKEWPTGQDESSAVSIAVMREDTRATVAGTSEAVLGRADQWAWHPAAPLDANTPYRVNVATTDQPRSDIPDPTTASRTFSTGAALAPALDLEGALMVSLRMGSVPAPSCEASPCGGTCTGAERSALVADVDLPIVSGGVGTYSAWLALNDESPRVFDGPGEGRVSGGSLVDSPTFVMPQAGEPKTVSVEVVRESAAYRPCFAYNVWDLSGHAKSAEPACLPAVAPEGSEAAASMAAPGTPNASSQGGCAVAIPQARGSRGAYATFIALAWAAAIARRRGGRGNRFHASDPVKGANRSRHE